MTIPERKASEKHDYEILFKDSAEYFSVRNAKMIQEGQFVRFISFQSLLPNAPLEEEFWYPIINIHRIKRYAKKETIGVLTANPKNEQNS